MRICGWRTAGNVSSSLMWQTNGSFRDAVESSSPLADQGASQMKWGGWGRSSSWRSFRRRIKTHIGATYLFCCDSCHDGFRSFHNKSVWQEVVCVYCKPGWLKHIMSDSFKLILFSKLRIMSSVCSTECNPHLINTFIQGTDCALLPWTWSSSTKNWSCVVSQSQRQRHIWVPHDLLTEKLTCLFSLSASAHA